MISNQVLNIIHERWQHLLTDFDQGWLQPENLETFAAVTHQKGAALDNCWGFIDGLFSLLHDLVDFNVCFIMDTRKSMLSSFNLLQPLQA
jgi:hypothetical protein